MGADAQAAPRRVRGAWRPVRPVVVTAPPARPVLGANFRRLWLATAISSVGDGLVVVAFPLLATRFTSDPALVAGVVFAQRLPWLCFSLVGGAVADRVDRRRAMATADVFRAAVIALLGLLVLGDWAGLAMIYAAAVLLGGAETLFDNAAHAVVPAVALPDHLDRANGRLWTANVAGEEFAGPAVGGVVFALAAALPFLVDGVSFALSAVLVLSMRGRFAPAVDASAAGTRPSLRTSVAEGLRWVRTQPAIRLLLATVAALAFLQSGAFAILVLYALRVLHLRAAEFGLLLAVGAAGDVAGGLAASAVRARLGTVRTLAAALFVNAAAYLVLGLTATAVVAATMLVLWGLSVVIGNVVTASVRQRLVPDHLLGRVNSVYRLMAYGSAAIGALVGGVVARVWGLHAPFLIAGGAQLVLTLALVPLLRRRAADMDAVA